MQHSAANHSDLNGTTSGSPLGRLQIIGYASGNLGKNIVANSVSFFLIFYLTDILGLPAGLAGALLFVSLAWDAILDPLVGFLSDRTMNRFGKYGVFILFGAPLTSITFISIFTVPLYSPYPVLTVFICLVLFRSAYTLIDLPHNALLSRISFNSSERARIATTRFFFSSIGSLIISFASFSVFASSDLGIQQERFATYSLYAASISVAVMWISWFSVNWHDRNGQFQASSLREQLNGFAGFFRDKDAATLLGVAFLTTLFAPYFTKSMSYFCKYVLNDEQAIAFGLTAVIFGQAISTPFWGWLSTKIEKSTALAVSHLLFMTVVVLFGCFVSSFGIHFAALCFLAGWAGGGIYSIIWGMGPDIVDKLHNTRGVRSEAAYIGLLILAMKLALGIGVGIMGGLLTAFGYVPNVEQDSSAVFGIRLIISAAPFLGSLFLIILLTKYQLSHAAHHALVRSIPR